MLHLVRRIGLPLVVLAVAGCASGRGGGDSATSEAASAPPCQDIARPEAEAYREGPGDVPFSGTPPAVHNRDQVGQALKENFPDEIRETGGAAVALVWVHVQENGRVDSVEVDHWLGDGSFDEAVRNIARTMRFAPAVDEDGEAVPVWLQRCIRFSVKRVD